MTNNEIAPQNTRFMAILLSFLGGALDVYCHIHFHSLVATQTGNIVLLIADLHPDNWENTWIKLTSIFCFSIGFVLGIIIREKSKTPLWRAYSLIPLLLVTAITPILFNLSYLIVGLLGVGTGLMMLTFSDSQIESHPFTIMMTSGNYRKMLSSWYRFFHFSSEREKIKRQAVNYTIVVVSFVIGALIVALMDRLVNQWAIFSVTLCLTLVIYENIKIINKAHKNSN